MLPSRGTPDYKAAASMLLPFFIQFLENNSAMSGGDVEKVVKQSPHSITDHDTSITKP